MLTPEEIEQLCDELEESDGRVDELLKRAAAALRYQAQVINLFQNQLSKITSEKEISNEEDYRIT